MKIGELSKITGLATSKIRFYEDIGLLKLVKRAANGYRTYPPEAETVLHLISNGQKAGFSLDELSKLLPSDLSDWKHDQLLNALRQKLADIELMEKKLADNKRQLNSILNDIEAKPRDMACADNAKRVISQIGMGKGRR
ncbi:MerR family transcriptional regulator [Pseudoalteromonas sp. CO348]|uniref:MerR family transcriptional regulator n=1 Tax=unclassified Pseudoalteromonas TaxID=194690 RepID=UPI0010233858|nr:MULTISPECIES: MerR family transcriptional regulator [unclassified Pseudoalteromonas]MCG7539521.1 MerR family transcriptional regulator [Pseudoalteromonas sp. OF7H-1]RZG05625.1 MerR family transcriptional regulator [Pseudoalteromonas sp. CO348]